MRVRRPRVYYKARWQILMDRSRLIDDYPAVQQRNRHLVLRGYIREGNSEHARNVCGASVRVPTVFYC